MEQMPSNTPVMESKLGPAGWLQIWIKAVTKPSEQTFVDITESPDMSARMAYIWIFIAGTITTIIQTFMLTIQRATGAGSILKQIPGLEQYIPQTVGRGGGIGVLIGGLCFSPFAGLFYVLFFALGVAIIQWIAKLFGGTGTYEKMLYAFAAISVPVAIVSSLFSLLGVVPFVGICTGLLSVGLVIYSLVLQVMAVKGVNRFGWGQAAGSVFLPGCVVFIICACIIFGGFMLLVPAIRNSNFSL